MTRGDTDRPAGALHADADSLAAAAAATGGVHVALVADGSVDEWYRSVESAGPATPARSHLVSVDETLRGGAATAGGAASTAGRPVGDGVVLAAVEAPLSDPVEYLRAVLSAAGADDADGGTVVVDDPSALLPSEANVDPVTGELVGTAGSFDVEFHAAAAGGGEALSALSRRLPGVDDAADRALADRLVAHLRETDPTNFGYLRRHWREARRGLAEVEMTYPQSKQVHAALPEPESTPRTLGAALGALVAVGALGVWGDTVAANRYDLTAYDPARVDAVGSALDSLDG